MALLIENRPNPILAPLMLHFMSVVPPEWRFRFMGSPASLALVNSSSAIRAAVDIGKLDLTPIPSNMTTNSQEEISQFLTTLWLYETVLQPAEHLLVYQTDSMLCANSQQSINAWLDYDWVGAPWNPNGKWGGNGGLSLRRVSAIIDVLRNQVRAHQGGPEDVWLAERLASRPGARMANGTASLTFSGEMHGGEKVHVAGAAKIPEAEREKRPAGGGIDSDATAAEALDVDLWRDGFYEPMGYHTGDNGNTMHGGIWGTPEMRKHIWDYCPEVKLIFEMDAAEFVPGSCHSNWKRGLDGTEFGEMEERAEAEERGLGKRWDPNNVDENGYPYLPAGLMAW